MDALENILNRKSIRKYKDEALKKEEIHTILEAGMGRIPADSVGEIIESRDRKNAGRTLPACGLTLEEVFYDEAGARVR